MLPIFQPIQRLWKYGKRPVTLHKDGLETISEYRQRWRSIYIAYFTIFLMTLGFSVIVTGVWPYLDKLDPNAGKVFMGYVVAAYPLGQMLFGPVFGYWGNKMKSIRLPLYVSIGLFCLASAIYACLETFPSGSVKYIMFLSRFMVGVGSANTAVFRAYIAEATRSSERTSAISMASMAQIIGFTLGPSIQSCVTPLGKHGITIIPNFVELNMFTATGWINVAMSIVNFVLILPVCFKEQRIAAKEVMAKKGMESEKDTYKDIRIDHLAVWSLLVGFFVASFNFIIIETIFTSMTMDLYAWSRAEALHYVGLILTGGAILSTSTFIVLPALCRVFSERHVMIFCGFLPMAFGRGLLIPFLGGSPPKMAEPLHLRMDGIIPNFIGNSSENIELLGCPIAQEWCRTTPVLPMAQLLIGYAFSACGFPIAVTLLQTIYSNVLGCRPQGVWVGLIFGSGCLARVIGPVCIGFIYARYGMYWTFGMTALTVLLGMFWIWLIRHRLKPSIRMTAVDETAKHDPDVLDTRL